jgi:hypothetical protein
MGLFGVLIGVCLIVMGYQLVDSNDTGKSVAGFLFGIYGTILILTQITIV